MKSATYPLLLVSACSCASLLAALAKQHSDAAYSSPSIPDADRQYLAPKWPLVKTLSPVRVCVSGRRPGSMAGRVVELPVFVPLAWKYGHSSPQPIVMTTSEACTASVVSTVGSLPAMSMSTSASAATATGLRCQVATRPRGSSTSTPSVRSATGSASGSRN
jgi:hypothetical protein